MLGNSVPWEGWDGMGCGRSLASPCLLLAAWAAETHRDMGTGGQGIASGPIFCTNHACSLSVRFQFGADSSTDPPLLTCALQPCPGCSHAGFGALFLPVSGSSVALCSSQDSGLPFLFLVLSCDNQIPAGMQSSAGDPCR